jgi:hypothetical protein
MLGKAHTPRHLHIASRNLFPEKIVKNIPNIGIAFTAIDLTSAPWYGVIDLLLLQ